MWIIPLPLYVHVTKKKKYYLNLNIYRNSHFHVLNKAKVLFQEEVSPLLKDIPKLEHCYLEYTYFPGSGKARDISNILSIVDKFFSDVLVANSIIDDDNYNIISGVHYLFGKVDKDNPRVEVRISPHPFEQRDMKITTKSTTVVQLSNQDLESALRAYLAQFVTVEKDAAVTVSQTKDGYEVRIEQDSEAAPEPKKASKKLEPAEAMAALKEAEKTSEEPKQEEKKEPGEEEAPKPTKSLFAGLKRPQN